MTLDSEVNTCISEHAKYSEALIRNGQLRYCRLLRPHIITSPETLCQFVGARAVADIGSGRYKRLMMVYVCRYYESEVMR